MTCETSIELLPWLLNGTLEQPQKDELLQHLASCERCREALAETRDAFRLFTAHVSAEDLVAWVWDRPATVAGEVIERHLESCAQCAAEAELARMSRRLEEDEKVVLFPARKEERPRASFVWRAAALAASVALVVAAAGWWQSAQTASSLARQEEARPAPAPVVPPTEASRLAELETQVQQYETRQGELNEKLASASAAVGQLESQVARLMEPQVNTWNGTLEAGQYRGGEDEQILPHDRMANLSLEARSPETEREVTLLDATGKVIWKPAVPLRRDQGGYYSIDFSAGFLEPGRYTLQLWSVESGERVQRESYTLVVK
jgi:hypothetical protein